MGGRLSKEIFNESLDTGASDDINKVTKIALSLFGVCELTKNIRLVGYG